MDTNLILPSLHCERCEHNWTPRQSIVTICPKCKSKKWNIKKENPVKNGDKT